ncbi:MAG TPA: sugar-binding protein [Tepidisphaeraceae bacterium]|jgi:hypothetical protein|nr:sugar-binding protein [Tepidisphaeraceae bacterium]
MQSAPSTSKRPTGWKRHFTGQRLRIFIALSIAAHLFLGLSWGVPAYVQERRAEAQRQQAAMLEAQQRAAAEEAETAAKTKAAAETLADVKRQTRRAFESMVAALPQPKKDDVWNEIAPKLDPVQSQMADALADRATTETDLRNLQRELSGQMIDAVNGALNGNASETEAAAFMTLARERLLPELVRHYSNGMQDKVARPLQGDAKNFIETEANATKTTIDGLKAARDDAGKRLTAIRENLDAAQKATDIAHDAIARNADGKRNDEIAKLLANATEKLASATAAGDEFNKLIDSIIKTASSTTGAESFADRLTEAKTRTNSVLASAKPTADALARQDTTAAVKELTAAALAARTLGTAWGAANDEAGRARDRALAASGSAVGVAGRSTVRENVQSTFGGAYKEKASDRIAAVLSAAFAKRLEGRGITDAALVTKVTADVKALLEERLGSEPQIVTSAIKPLLTYGEADAAKPSTGAGMTDAFGDRSQPIVTEGINAVVIDDVIDQRLATIADEQSSDTALDAAADRIATVASNQNAGRSTGGGFAGIGSSVLTSLRSDAIQRADDTQNGMAAANGTASTQPFVDPLLTDVKRDLTEALARDLKGLLEGKLNEDQAEKFVETVTTAGDADVSRLAANVLDGRVSDSDLEASRTEFSMAMMGHVNDALDATATADVEAELFKQLTGDAGTALADNIRKAVAKEVGNELASGFANAARDERQESAASVQALRGAIDTMRDTTAKASEIVEGSRVRAQRAANEAEKAKPDAPAADSVAVIKAERERLTVVRETLSDARTTLKEATANAKVGSERLRAALGDLETSLANVTQRLADADAAAAKGDVKAFAGAVDEVKKALDPYRKAVTTATTSLQSEPAQAGAQLLKAAESTVAKDGEESKVASKVNAAFEEEFRQATLPRLTDQIVNAYKEKMAKAGVDTEAGEAALREKVAAELQKQVSTGTSVADGALAEVDRRGTFKEAAKATGEPDAAMIEKANAAADNAVKAGVTTALGGNRGGAEVGKALSAVKGPSQSILELKDKFARMEGQLRGGRGGLLDEPAADAELVEGEQPGSVAGVRKKWQSILASAAGAGEGNGTGSAGEAGASGAQGSGWRWGRGVNPFGHWVDEEQYQALIAKLKDRDKQLTGGQAFARVGATGDASNADADADIVRPATIVAPTTQPASKAEGDQPYVPTFKSLAFATAPYLTDSIKIDGSFDDWKDIPALQMKPERFDGTGQEGLTVADTVTAKVAWDKHGLYFMLDMADPDRSMKTTAAGTFWVGDTFEIFLDTMNSKENARARGAGQQFWVWPLGSVDDPTLPGGESFVDGYSSFKFVPFKSHQMQRAMRKTDAGYQLECRVDTIHIRDADLAPGKILGLNMTAETGTRVHYYWTASKATATFARPDTWGDLLLGGADGRLEIPERLSDEDGAGDATQATSSFLVGQPLRLRVSDGDMNLNSRIADKVMVTVANPSNGDSQVAILKETGADTGIFEGAIRTVLDIGEKQPGAVSVFDGQKLRVTYVDQARANGARDAKVVFEAKAGSPVIGVVAAGAN